MEHKTNASYHRYRDLFRPNEGETRWVIAAYLAEHLNDFTAWLEAHSPKHAAHCVGWVSQQHTAMLDAQRLLALAPLMSADMADKLRIEDKRLSAEKAAALFGTANPTTPSSLVRR